MSVFSEAKMTVGTSAYNLVQLDGIARLPAVDGSLLTNVNGGKVAQVVSSMSGAVATGTTVMPWDDTIPQNTEGTEFYSVSITPKNASSKLIIITNIIHANSVGYATVAGIFVDSTADAIGSWVDTGYSSAGFNSLNNHIFIIDAGSTTARTYKLRAGPATASTLTINGVAGARKLGGVLSSGIIVIEILPGTAAITNLSAATQTDMESATSDSVVVTAAKQQYHPGTAKFWIEYDQTGTLTIISSYNVTSVTDEAVGDCTITIGTDFSSANWSCVVSGSYQQSGSTTITGGSATIAARASAKTAGTVRIATSTGGIATSGLTDFDLVFVVGYGDQ